IMVPVVLNVVSPATLSANPTSMTFSYTLGQQVPPSQSLTVTASPSVPITATVSASSAWLTVTPAQSAAPANLSVAVVAGTMGAGTYTGTISIASPNALTPVTVPVPLNILSIPKPVIASVANAGSYATGPVAPGENIVLFGPGVGPATLAVNTPAAD